MSKKVTTKSAGAASRNPQKHKLPVQKRTDYNVTPQQFVEAWQSSETAQEVADKLGMPKPIVLARAAGYRSNGVKLKKMKRGNAKSTDVDELNRLIERLRSGQAPEVSIENLLNKNSTL